MLHNKISILFIEFLEKTSAIHLIPILKALSKNKKYNIILLGQTNSFLVKKSKTIGIKTYAINYVEFNTHKLKTYIPFLRTLFLLCKIISQNSINIIHCHRLNWAYLAVIASKIFRISLLIDIVFIEKLTSKVQNYLIKHHQNVIYLAVSKYAKQKFHNLYNIPLEKIIVYCSGITVPPKINERQKNTILKKIKDKKIVAMVSRLAPSKGVDIFIEAAGILQEKWKDVRFVFIGNQKNIIWENDIWKGNYLEECKKRIHNLKMDKKFFILDFTYYDINYLYPFFYCTVLPTWLESLGYVALESQAYKKPIVITKVGGASETINNGKAGISIPFPPSPVLLAKEIDKLLSNKKHYHYYSKSGYLWVKNNFNINKNINILLNIYKSLVKK